MTAEKPTKPVVLPPEVLARIRRDAAAKPPTPEQVRRTVQILRAAERARSA